MLALALSALAAVAPQDGASTETEREIQQLIEPGLSNEELAQLSRARVLDVVERAVVLLRLQSFERRLGESPRDVSVWPATADRLEALIDAMHCPPDWLPEQDPLGRETLVARATLLAALGRDEQADADLDRLAAIGAPDEQRYEAQLGFLRAARAERRDDSRAAWDQRMIAASSGCSARRADLRDVALVQLALALEEERRPEDARALLAAVATRSGTLAGPGAVPRFHEYGRSVVASPSWVREWAARELARLDSVLPHDPDRLEWLDVYSVVAFRILPQDAAQAPRLLAVVHRDGAPHSTVLRPDRDDLADVPDWLAAEFHRAPANWA